MKTRCLKVSYLSKKKAWNSSLYFFIKKGTFSSVYKCHKGKHFHLTAKRSQKSEHNDNLPPEFIIGFNKWYGKEILKK